MFLSRVQLNPARRSARPLLSSPHALHAAVMASFPDPSPTQQGRVLWRLDLEDHVANVYIASPREPDLISLAEQGGWPSLAETRATRPYAPLLARLQVGEQYAFRLTANPTRSRGQNGGGRGKVYGHVTVAQQERWLLDREERSGFRVRRHGDLSKTVGDRSDGESLDEVDVVVRHRRTVSFSRRETRVTLRTVTYDGTLEVTDPSLLAHALAHGIGRAKGYGCGLMTLAPVS